VTLYCSDEPAASVGCPPTQPARAELLLSRSPKSLFIDLRSNFLETFLPSSPLPFRVYPTNTSSLIRMATFKTFVTTIALSAGLVQIASASAVKRWGVPLPACTPATPFVYAGCFSDMGSTDALEYRSEVNYDNMTIEACVDFCKGNLPLFEFRP
jgi:hypothetical protein